MRNQYIGLMPYGSMRKDNLTPSIHNLSFSLFQEYLLSTDSNSIHYSPLLASSKYRNHQLHLQKNIHQNGEILYSEFCFFNSFTIVVFPPAVTAAIEIIFILLYHITFLIQILIYIIHYILPLKVSQQYFFDFLIALTPKSSPKPNIKCALYQPFKLI